MSSLVQRDSAYATDSDGDRVQSTRRSSTVHAKGRSEWWRSASVITGEIMGTGLLSLPHACARLGWVLGLSSSICFGAAALYAGHLLSRVRNDLYPAATSYADVAACVSGPRFELFTRVTLVIGWFMSLPYYLVASSKMEQMKEMIAQMNAGAAKREAARLEEREKEKELRK